MVRVERAAGDRGVGNRKDCLLLVQLSQDCLPFWSLAFPPLSQTPSELALLDGLRQKGGSPLMVPHNSVSERASSFPVARVMTAVTSDGGAGGFRPTLVASAQVAAAPDPAGLVSENRSAGIEPTMAAGGVLTRVRLLDSPVKVSSKQPGPLAVPLLSALRTRTVAPLLKTASLPLPLPNTLNSLFCQSEARSGKVFEPVARYAAPPSQTVIESEGDEPPGGSPVSSSSLSEAIGSVG